MVLKPVVFFGELLLRLSASKGLLLRQSSLLEVQPAGAEANVAIALAQWKVPTRLISALPDNDLGEMAVEQLQRYGVDTQGIIRQQERMGLYFYQSGEGLRAGKVIYDRQYSAFAQAQAASYNWSLLQNACWLHSTGITPLVSKQAAEALLHAVNIARQQGMAVSLDLNFRKSLWNAALHSSTMEVLLKQVNFLIADLTSLSIMANISAQYDKFTDNPVTYYRAAQEFFSKNPQSQAILFSLRENLSAEAFHLRYVLCRPNSWSISNIFKVEHASERIGAGDAATAAALYGWLNGFSDEKICNLAAAASALKHFIKGDQLLATWQEIESIAEGKINYSIQR